MQIPSTSRKAVFVVGTIQVISGLAFAIILALFMYPNGLIMWYSVLQIAAGVIQLIYGSGMTRNSLPAYYLAFFLIVASPFFLFALWFVGIALPNDELAQSNCGTIASSAFMSPTCEEFVSSNKNLQIQSSVLIATSLAGTAATALFFAKFINNKLWSLTPWR